MFYVIEPIPLSYLFEHIGNHPTDRDEIVREESFSDTLHNELILNINVPRAHTYHLNFCDVAGALVVLPDVELGKLLLLPNMTLVFLFQTAFEAQNDRANYWASAVLYAMSIFCFDCELIALPANMNG